MTFTPINPPLTDPLGSTEISNSMTTHIWLRAEQRNNEQRVALTHEGAKTLVDAGMQLSVEASSNRALALDGYKAAGVQIVEEFSWPNAPDDAFILGLKELPEEQTPLKHRHICLLYTSPSPRDATLSRMPSSA